MMQTAIGSESQDERGSYLKRILIVSDGQMFALLLAQLLTRCGYETLVARSGEEGIAWFQKTSPHLVLLNTSAGEKEDLENIAKLQRAFGDAGLIAFVGRESKSGLKIPSVAKRIGVRYVFSKPFRTEEVLEAVEEELREAGSERMRLVG